MIKEYIKKCPTCNKEMTYPYNYRLQQSLREKWNCRSCSRKGLRIKPEEKLKRRKKREKEYSEKNQTKINKQSREYQNKKRKDPLYMKKQKEYMKEYNQRPETIQKNRIRRNEYNKIKRKDPLVKMSRNISSSMRQSIKSKNLSKNGRHWEDIIGYTIQQLKEHIEKQFKPGMNWNNLGKNGWVLDHIIPRNFFKYKSINDTEFLYCWSLFNLQPLWAIDNLSKSDEITLWGKKIKAKNINKDYFSKL